MITEYGQEALNTWLRSHPDRVADASDALDSLDHAARLLPHQQHAAYIDLCNLLGLLVGKQ